VDIGPPQPLRAHHGSTSTCSSVSTLDSADGGGGPGGGGRELHHGARHSLASTSTTSGSSSMSEHLLESLQEKRRHVLNELIETEKTYVTQLHYILRVGDLPLILYTIL